MKWIFGLLCLIFLIIFHEFGHFIAAKLFGVKVESFSVGFGPILLHKTFKGTDYRISLLPLGGYCGMKGEKEFSKALEENLKYIPADKDSLYGIHPIKRALIGFAGPFFNFLFAVIASTLIAWIGYTYYTYSNDIQIATEVYPEIHSAAADAGLMTGDKIIEINNIKITDFSDIVSEVSIRPDEDLLITVDRNGKQLSFSVHSDLNKEDGTGKIGIMALGKEVIKKETEKYNFFTGIEKGIKDTLKNIGITLKSISILFKGVKVQNAVSGPARVTDILGTTIKEGFSVSFRAGIISLLNLTGIISISLFIMNLLPIPVLDGGLILVALIECIFRRKINPKIQYYIQFIGIAFIIVIFFIGLSGDISYFIKNGAK